MDVEVKLFINGLKNFQNSISSSGRKIREIGISHAQGLEFHKSERVLQKFVEKPISILDTNTTIATHTGPGAWAIMIDYDDKSKNMMKNFIRTFAGLLLAIC